jgi:hypothetical protein
MKHFGRSVPRLVEIQLIHPKPSFSCSAVRVTVSPANYALIYTDGKWAGPHFNPL